MTPRGGPGICIPLVLRKRILIVDDDSAVSSVSAEMIRALGHMAVTAWGVESALSIWNETGRAFDLAIVDYNLGVDSGIALARRLQREKPGMPVVIASGMIREILDLPAGMGFIAKPFSLAELQAAIKSA